MILERRLHAVPGSIRGTQYGQSASRTLIFLEYAPVPAKSWRQLHSIYEFAEQLGQEHASLAPPGAENGVTTSVALAYKRIVMASLADPYRLPFGAIWEIYEQLPAWTDKVSIGPFTTVEDPADCFVVNLEADERPIPYARFDPAKVQSRHRLVNAAPLGNLIRDEIRRSAP